MLIELDGAERPDRLDVVSRGAPNDHVVHAETLGRSGKRRKLPPIGKVGNLRRFLRDDAEDAVLRDERFGELLRQKVCEVGVERGGSGGRK